MLPTQDVGTRPARALPYALSVGAEVDRERAQLTLRFDNHGRAGAVFHVYDRLHLDRLPRRYTVEAGRQLPGTWTLADDAGRYDLWVLGPNGFHRHFVGACDTDARADTTHAALFPPELRVGYDTPAGNLYLVLKNPSARVVTFNIAANAYYETRPTRLTLTPNSQTARYFWLRASGHWYDFTVTVDELASWSRRLAGRVETGRDSISDPAQGGAAWAEQIQNPYPPRPDA